MVENQQVQKPKLAKPELRKAKDGGGLPIMPPRVLLTNFPLPVMPPIGRERASPATALEFLKRYKKGGALRLVFIVRGRTPIADVTLRKQHRGGPGSLVSLPPNAALRFAASTVHAVALRRERRTGAISTVFERPSSSANSACSRMSCGKAGPRLRPLCRASSTNRQV